MLRYFVYSTPCAFHLAILIGQEVWQQKIFWNMVDRRSSDDGRTLEDRYTVSSPCEPEPEPEASQGEVETKQ